MSANSIHGLHSVGWLPPACLGTIAVCGGLEVASAVMAVAPHVRECVLSAGNSALGDTAFCRKCREEFPVEEGSHCNFCSARLRSMQEWDMWSIRLRQRLILELLSIREERLAFEESMAVMP